MRSLPMILILSLSVTFIQAQDKTIREITDTDFGRALSYMLQNMGPKLYKAAYEGKIKAYPDQNMSAPYHLKEIEGLGKFCETISIFIDPDDPEKTKDSVVCTIFDPYFISALAIYGQLSSTRPWSGAIGLLYVRKDNNGQVLGVDPVFLIKASEAAAHLSKDERELLIQFYAYSERKKTQAAFIQMDDTALRDYALFECSSIKKTVLQAALAGKVPAYDTDTMNRAYTISQLKQKIQRTDSILQADSSHALMVVAKTTDYPPGGIKSFNLVESWLQTAGVFSGKITGVSLNGEIFISGIQLPPQPFFYIGYKDFSKLLVPAQRWLLEQASFYSRMKRVDAGYHYHVNFYDFQKSDGR